MTLQDEVGVAGRDAAEGIKRVAAVTVKRANRANSPWTPELAERVLALAGEGMSATAIGLKVGMTKMQIIGWCYRHHKGALWDRGKPHDGPTLWTRMQALHDVMDAELARAKLVKRIRVTTTKAM
jgi:hypothetical protein